MVYAANVANLVPGLADATFGQCLILLDGYSFENVFR